MMVEAPQGQHASLYAYKPLERSMRMAQGITGAFLGSRSRDVVHADHRPVIVI